MSNRIESDIQILHMQISDSLMLYANPLVFIYMNEYAYRYLSTMCNHSCDAGDIEVFGYKAFVIDNNKHPSFTFSIIEKLGSEA